ncbi:MAG TPA: NYN domain-containing protein [Dysgonomonas sp.]|uniref:NYN domain-containing protein n=1 Tax=unclassified Dysgonomonas TaxID=2630389 RepID=UPI0025BA0030|nr:MULTISPECIES: NYN domain-containing protein [unclassified Dysgonomonas]HML65305.1 NYN domain-containing protein [Dysgonomonas sp.]
MKKKDAANNKNLKLAILVDADNASATKLNEVLVFTARYGQATVKRIYGDWGKSALSGWKEPAREYSFRLIEALPYVKGKNTTDISLIIDAMDLLHAGSVDGFCIVSSDSDYTLLAQRIREEGLLVFGYGESKTPESFVNSCREFVFSDKQGELPVKHGSGETPETILKKEGHLFDKAYNKASNDGKSEVTLSQLGMAIKKILPKYKPRRYGCKTLGEIYEKLGAYEITPTEVKGIYNVIRKKNE